MSFSEPAAPSDDRGFRRSVVDALNESVV